ncbi:hypothetical protein BDM02DRAFT_3117514 [Thelephora ganbajun]|uniref:Uncharacterized protein n=1 Tax=Thelephora ganbajun TaxID=370292 RepID=A0ACB6ZC63_THEGA|nr:hypothetical protein BDM02DRAFT_3117514 [Thelephora ganbajun]
MNSKRLRAATIFALSAFGPRSFGVWAQSDMAVCNSGWDWNKNSLGQDPCAISSILDAACRGVGSYSIPVLNSTQNYVPPQRNSTSDLTCDCDTVMYSLYMACSTCQGGRIYAWTKWIAQCDSVYVTQYPHDVAQGTTIPRWAFYNITSLPDQIYNDTVAMAIGRNPEATPRSVSTVNLDSNTLTTHTRTLSLTPSSSSSAPEPTDTGSGGQNNTGAIVGGVVGGVVALIILAVIAAFCIRRRRRSGGTQPLPPPHTQEVSEHYKVQQTSPILSPTTANLPYNPYYNPEDPNTFPPPMGDGQSSLTYVNPPLSPHGPHGGRYSGIPEI